MSQIEYNDEFAKALHGMVADSRRDTHVESFLAAAAMPSGSVVLKGADVAHARLPSAAALAADADALVASGFASTAGVNLLDGVELNGVIGQGIIDPPAFITATFNASTDWDPTSMTLTIEDVNGDIVTDTLAIATSTTGTGAKLARRLISASIPAQTGAGGTATIGISGTGRTLARASVAGVVIRETMREPRDYVAEDPIPVLRRGSVWLTCEDAHVKDSSVYVRFILSGTVPETELAGAIRSTPDSTDCLRWPGALIRSAGAAGALALVEFDTVG